MHMAALLTLLMATSSPAVANKPVPELDLQRYTGAWHEIAHLPMYFQRKCVDNITATYTARKDGSIEVRNACRKPTAKKWNRSAKRARSTAIPAS